MHYKNNLYHTGLRLSLVGLILLLNSFTLIPDAHIHFHTGDLPAAIHQAQEENKLVFVDVYASWCTSCKLMEESTFRSDRVAGLVNDHYIPVKLNIDSIEGEIFAAQEGITVLPALLVLNQKGDKLSQVNQALQTEGMVKLLKKTLTIEAWGNGTYLSYIVLVEAMEGVDISQHSHY